MNKQKKQQILDALDSGQAIEFENLAGTIKVTAIVSDIAHRSQLILFLNDNIKFGTTKESTFFRKLEKVINIHNLIEA